jgi:hypothetical protein
MGGAPLRTDYLNQFEAIMSQTAKDEEANLEIELSLL